MTREYGSRSRPGNHGSRAPGSRARPPRAFVTLMKAELYGAAFGGHPLNAKEANGLLAAANGLLAQAAALA